MVKGPFEWADFCVLSCKRCAIIIKLFAFSVGLKCMKKITPKTHWPATMNLHWKLALERVKEWMSKGGCIGSQTDRAHHGIHNAYLLWFYRSQLNQFVKLLSHRYFELWCWYRCCCFWYPLQLCDDVRGPLKDTLCLSYAERKRDSQPKITNNTHTQTISFKHIFRSI